MSLLVLLSALLDAGLLLLLASRLYRSRREGASLRLRIFGALAAATLAGALLTGTYVVAEEALRTGVRPVAARIAPKAFVVGSTLLALSAAGASAVGRGLSRSVEELTEAATRIAEGELSTRLPRGEGKEARRLSRALASMRRELEGRPYAAAFLRDAWHDLKTPAAALKATIEVLSDGAMEEPDAARRFLANLRRSCDQLERTLADLVTLSRFETAALGEESTVAVGAIVAQTLEAMKPLAEARGVTLVALSATQPVLGERLRPLGRLRCDPAAVARALGNLVENAVIATHRGTVSVSLHDGSAAFLVLEVLNEPASVPLEMRHRLFERAATSRRGSGSGLGLAIARAAVEAHGGQIKFVELGPPRVRVRIELPR